MDFSRLISPALRSALLVAVGTVLLAAPFALGLSVAAVVTAATVGIIAIGLGLAGTAHEGRGTIPLSAHAAYDRGLALGLLIAGVAFGLAGQPGALAFFGAAAVVQVGLTIATRYSASVA
jgi:hypothetical protein